MSDDDYAVLTAAEVAEWLRISERHVRELVARGSLLPLAGVGRRLLFARHMVRGFVESNGARA